VPRPLVVDCSIVSAFVDLGCLAKLNRLMMKKRFRLIMPDLVLEELSSKITRSELRKRVRFSETKSKVTEIDRLRTRFISLGDGELSVISCALIRTDRESKNPLAWLDDRTARAVAKNFKLKVIGTVGLLKLMLDERIISKKELEAYCKTLRNNGFYLTDRLILDLMHS